MNQTKSLFEQYIDTIPSGQMRINAKGMWKWVSSYLKSHNMEITNIDRAQISALLRSRATPIFTTMRNRVATLRGFYEFCVLHRVLERNPMADFSYRDIDYTDSFRQCFWPNYLTLLNTLKQLWATDEGLYIYPVVTLAWIGVPVAEAPILPDSQVSIDNRVVHSSIGNLPLSEEMADVLNQYRNFSSSRRANRITMIRTYQSDAFLYRLDILNRLESDCSSAPVNISSVITEANKILTEKHLCTPLKYNNLVKSGCLRRMCVMEYEGHPYEEIINYGRKFLKPPAGYPGDATFMYECYKKAFDFK